MVSATHTIVPDPDSWRGICIRRPRSGSTPATKIFK